jgi:hypothetical protein
MLERPVPVHAESIVFGEMQRSDDDDPNPVDDVS